MREEKSNLEGLKRLVVQVLLVFDCQIDQNISTELHISLNFLATELGLKRGFDEICQLDNQNTF